ncbi:unnamed protein product [Cuscuta epithymum]|uniref:Thioredoxin domain-containing protein n=1 Tax=Cuscuta epithymum TaxID=186058 RepID=A0AAV0C4C1_9ASTE|nr:unnamed protein product [Cuscuta epithymum]
MAATAAASTPIAEEGQVISCQAKGHLTNYIEKGKESNRLVVVDFTASWCPPCRFIAPILADYAKKLPHVIFLKVDVDEVEEAAKEFEVEAMPTFVFLKDGKVVDRVVGAEKVKLQIALDKHAAQASA